MGLFNRYEMFPKNHRDVTSLASNTVNLPVPALIYCGSDGTIAVHDMKGTAVTYTVSRGDILPVMVNRVLTTGTTVTQIIALY